MEILKNIDVYTTLAILLALVVLYYLTSTIWHWATVRSVKAVVLHKERITPPNSKEMYIIYTDMGILQNTDIPCWGKWNSSDIYGAVRVGRVYTFKICSARIRLFSWYPKIISVKNTSYKKGKLGII